MTWAGTEARPYVYGFWLPGPRPRQLHSGIKGLTADD